MRQADGLILVSPVYALSVTALMKNFLDRMAYVIHRPRFFDKYALVVSTTGAAYLKDTLNLMGQNAEFWGYNLVGKVGLVDDPKSSSRAKSEEKIAAAARRFYQAIRQKKVYSPSLFRLIMFNFQQMVFSNLEEWNAPDHQYFKEQGWLEPGARFYTGQARVGLVKPALARLVRKIFQAFNR
jgi:hypothetical protein